MKTYCILPIFLLCLVSCGTSKKTTETVTSTTNQHVNEATLENFQKSNEQANTKPSMENPDILVGVQHKEALLQPPFNTWFSSNYSNYNPNEEVVEKLSPLLKDITIKVFMGTWCGDSKRETPAFYKILEAADYDLNNLQLITVTREKNTPQGFEKGLDIERVPTFIFYRDGMEIGRYVEFAQESLEKDMLAIFSGKDYKHSYED